jgi:hypothetical protein
MACSLFALAALSTSAGCGSTDGVSPAEGTDESSQEVIARARPRTIELSYTFDKSDEGFETIFADYPAGQETFYELASGSAPIPNVGGTGMMVAGNNHSDDLWMSVAHGIGLNEGVVPGTKYNVTITTKIASNAPTGCFGVGGAPGEALWIKGNVVTTKPRATTVAGNKKFSANKGNQAENGAAASFGNLGNGDECDGSAPVYKIIERTATTQVTAPWTGQLYLYLGTDSGFEGKTTYFIDDIKVTLTPR